MSVPWRKIENEEGFTYYLNDLTSIKQWDHPKFVDIRQRLDDCNYVKYSIYRLALKFRVLQNALHTEEVPLSIVAEIFDRHRLGANESSLCLESCDLEAVLSDMYFASNKKNHTNIDIDFATELMLNFLYNVYDRNRKGNIQVGSTKIVLSLLSNCTFAELYKFIFALCADHNNCVTRLRLQSLLFKIIEIATFFHEDVSFGTELVNTSIESCFSNSPGLVGINESMFISWLESGPKIFAWIPLLHRIKVAEQAVHTVTCTTCKTNPMIGLKYKCIKCSRYTQCQRCFFTGRTSHTHKLTHSMREYCTQANDHSHTFIKKICGLLYCSQKINNSTIVETKPLCSDRDSLPKSFSKEILCDVEPLSSPQTQLQVIIRQLEMQNRELQQILLLGSHSEKDIRRYLEEHRIHVAAQIQKLKILKDYLKVPPHLPIENDRKKQELLTVESTPMVPTISRPNRSVGLELFSPIQSITENSQRGHNNDAPDFNKDFTRDSSVPYGIEDISTWMGGQPATSAHLSVSTKKTNFPRKSPVRELHNDLDDALAKLHQILANNFSLDESLGHIDNTNLKYAVSEVEGMLTSFIDSVETSRGSSVRSHRLNLNKETDILEKCG